MGLYKVLGIKKVLVYANCDVGGYAWARFGFKPNSWSSHRTTISNNLDRMAQGDKSVTTSGRTSNFRKFTPLQVSNIRTLINSSDPESMWHLADMEENGNDLGKALLLGMNWHGTLDMGHEKTMRRFTRYVNG